MIDLIKRFFGPEGDGSNDESSHHDVRVATAAIFLEMSQIDSEFKPGEARQVIELLQSNFGLSAEHAEELARAAHSELQGSHDLWRFASLVNQNYSREEKLQVVELLWRVIYADGRLDEHEQYLVTKLRKMLHITHRDLIDAKLKVLSENRDA